MGGIFTPQHTIISGAAALQQHRSSTAVVTRYSVAAPTHQQHGDKVSRQPAVLLAWRLLVVGGENLLAVGLRLILQVLYQIRIYQAPCIKYSSINITGDHS